MYSKGIPLLSTFAFHSVRRKRKRMCKEKQQSNKLYL